MTFKMFEITYAHKMCAGYINGERFAAINGNVVSLSLSCFLCAIRNQNELAAFWVEFHQRSETH